jgi:hypothetical protein
VETQVVGGSGTESLEVSVPPGIASLRELLAALVRHELASYERRRAVSTALRVLTAADLVRGEHSGSYGREARAVPAPPPESAAIERAVEAFADGLFFAFVDDVQVEALDAPLAVGPGSTLRLVRLVALAGG